MIKLLLKEIYQEELFSERKKHLDLDAYKKLDGDERGIWLRRNATNFGTGSARAVYLIDSSKVLKHAMNAKGIAQNQAELEAYTNPKVKPIVAQIYDYDNNFKWLISELVKPMQSFAEFEELSGVDFPWFRNQLWSIQDKTIAPETFEKSPMLRQVASLIKHEKSMVADMQEMEHWGKTSDGRLVLLDYGYNTGVAKKYYGVDIPSDDIVEPDDLTNVRT